MGRITDMKVETYEIWYPKGTSLDEAFRYIADVGFKEAFLGKEKDKPRIIAMAKWSLFLERDFLKDTLNVLSDCSDSDEAKLIHSLIDYSENGRPEALKKHLKSSGYTLDDLQEETIEWIKKWGFIK